MLSIFVFSCVQTGNRLLKLLLESYCRVKYRVPVECARCLKMAMYNQAQITAESITAMSEESLQIA